MSVQGFRESICAVEFWLLKQAILHKFHEFTVSGLIGFGDSTETLLGLSIV